MRDAPRGGARDSTVDRRSFLSMAGTSAWLSAFGTGRSSGSDADRADTTAAGPDDTSDSEYERVIDVVEAGADPDGEEPITPVLRDVVGDDTLLEFPDGRYLMDEQLRFTDFDTFGMVGAEDATIVPAPATEYRGEARLFKLGTHYAPGTDLRIENLTFDFTADETGLRAIQAQIDDGVTVRGVSVDGRHDAGTWGPLLVDVVDPDGTGLLADVDLADGGAYTENTAGAADPAVDTGPTGFLLSEYHEGRLTCRDVRIGAFPDNGLYVSGDAGRVVVEGGRFANSNVAGIRLAGDDSAIRGATLVVDDNRPEDETQRAIRLDGGSNLLVEDVDIDLTAPNGEAVAVTGAADSVRIEGTSIAVRESANQAISVRSDAGRVEIVDVDVATAEGGHALFLDRGDDGALVEAMTVTGDASGAYGGRCAIRCERDGTTFRRLAVEQPGDGYRRAIGVHADDCEIRGGEYRATHHPVITSGDAVEIHEITARSYDGYEALKLVEGTGHVDVSHSVLYEGILDRGAEDLETWDNEYPDG